MRGLLMIGVLALAGCGADGEPIRPSYTGNVTLSQNGVHAGGGVSMRKGPVTFGVGF